MPAEAEAEAKDAETGETKDFGGAAAAHGPMVDPLYGWILCLLDVADIMLM